MRIIMKLKTLWFVSFVIFGIGLLLELSNRELNPSTLIVFIIYAVLYFIASKQSDQKTNQST